MYAPPPHGKHSSQQPNPPFASERIADLLDQLKGEYQTMDAEFTVTKQQRDDYERKRL